MSHITIDARIINSSTGRYIERLLHYLQQIDDTNEYSILLLKKDLEYWKPTNSNFKVVEADFKQYSISEQIGLNKLLNKLSPDLVHFCMPQQPVLYKGNHVTTFHDMTLINFVMPDKNWLVYRFKQFVGGFVFRKVARTSSYIICPSENTKKELLEFVNIPDDKFVITYEAADVVPVAPHAYQTGYDKYILYVGQQADYKNIKKLGTAHQRLIKKYPDLGLVLVGKKDEPALINEKYFNNRDYKNITFTGFVTDEELSWLYSNAEAYIFPSLAEGFGLPGLEAMNYKTPVVAGNLSCLPEIYGDAAHYFDPLDVTDMAKSIDEVLSDNKLRKQLLKNAENQLKKYSWHKMAKETHEIYLKALEK